MFLESYASEDKNLRRNFVRYVVREQIVSAAGETGNIFVIARMHKKVRTKLIFTNKYHVHGADLGTRVNI